jgi:succinyl-CoA synthetase beta subunit
MNIHEYLAKKVFQSAGIPTSDGRVAVNAADAVAIANDFGYPVVVKAQVLTGGRGKAGGVKLAANDEELKTHFENISRLNIKGYDVEKILIAKAVDIRREFYCSITVDSAKGDVVIIASAAGGVDIEQTAKEHPEQIKKFYLRGERSLDIERWKAFSPEVFDDASLQEQSIDIARKLVELFFRNDCSLAEINPLAVDEKGRLIAADAKINFDDNALYRQPENAGLRDMKYEDADELEAKEKGLSFVKLEGNVGCIVNGAGLAMGTMDAIKHLGGKPANFLDVGGSSNPEKVLSALNIILRNKDVRVILINIFGGITRCDDIAKGLLAARAQIEIPVPLVVRLTGTNENEAKELLSAEGLNTFTSMREAVNEAVKLAAAQ